MTARPSVSSSARMAALVEALRNARQDLTKLSKAAKSLKRKDIQTSLRATLEATETVLCYHLNRPSPTIADDIADILTAFGRLNIPRADSNSDSQRGVEASRSAIGNIRHDLSEILQAASALGWWPGNYEPSDFDATKVLRDDIDGSLKGIVLQMEAVERLLDRTIRPGGETTPQNSPIQIALVNVFIENFKTEISLAKLAARMGEMVDLAALGRAITSVDDLTTTFVVSIRGMRLQITTTLQEASEQLQEVLQQIVRGFRTIVNQAAFIVSHQQSGGRFRDDDLVSGRPPSDFDLEAVRQLILQGQTIKTAWQPWIKVLHFQSCGLSDLVPLAPLINLQKLFLVATKVTDLTPLTSLMALDTLTVTHTPVSDLSPLGGLSALLELNLYKTDISDLTPLTGLTRLQTLLLAGSRVKNLAPLENAAGLKTLDLTNTAVADIAPISCLYSLRYLYLAGTNVTDLGPLSQLAGLQSVYVESEVRQSALAKTLGKRGAIVKVLK
jgi:Leucine-rich repeat (LRR) protein